MTIQIGTPAMQNLRVYKTGYVAEIKPATPGLMAITARGMESAGDNLVIAWDDESTSEVSTNIAKPWLEEAARCGVEPNPEGVADMLAKAKAKQTADYQRRMAEVQHAKDAAGAFVEQIRPLIPADAKAVIIAERVQDQSDSQSDYFGSTTTETILLAWSRHTRDLFPEMRKAAHNHEKTAHLADAAPDAEHREKWSMGGGYYLKDGYRHSDGWRVSKTRFYGDGDRAERCPVGEISDAIKGKAAPAPKPTGVGTGTAPDGTRYRIEKIWHAKRGCDIWIASPTTRLARDVFESERDRAKASGGWYSRKFGQSPAGFGFDNEDAANAFAGAKSSDAVEAPAALVVAGRSDKLRDIADSLQGDINSKRADRLENTPKRQRQAGQARQDADKLERAQKGLRALADLEDAGKAPSELSGLSTKKAALELAESIIDHSNCGYYDIGRDTWEPRIDTPAAHAFWSLLKPRTAEDTAKDALRDLETQVSRMTIPGYFPTPENIISDMLAVADVQPGHLVLEPSAGAGAILDVVRAFEPAAVLTACEVNRRLCEILELKGYAMARNPDFFDLPFRRIYDRVLMNPPFEKGQDCDHVQHAFDFLKPGGRLVAIMSPAWTYATRGKPAAFREWINSLESFDVRHIDAGAFKSSGTEVATVMVTIDKQESGQ